MFCSLNNHDRQYSVSTIEALLSPLASPYASRHFELAASPKTHSTTVWRHLVIGCIQAFPFVGLIATVIERIVSFVYNFFQKKEIEPTTKQEIKVIKVIKTIPKNSLPHKPRNIFNHLDNDSLLSISKFLDIKDASSFLLTTKKVSSHAIWKGQANRWKITIPRKNEELKNLLKKGAADQALLDFFKHVPRCRDQVTLIESKTDLSIFQKADEFRKWPMTNLRERCEIIIIKICNKGIKSIPPEIGLFDCVTEIDLSDNLIETLPPEIGEIAFNSLNLKNNRLRKLPEIIWKKRYRTRLFYLNVSGNQLTKLPKGILKLSGLASLNISKNNIQKLPKILGKFKRLRLVNFSHNPLKDFPEDICKSSSLRTLRMAKTQITQLPNNRDFFNKLESLDCTNNPLDKASSDLVKHKSQFDPYSLKNRLSEDDD